MPIPQYTIEMSKKSIKDLLPGAPTPDPIEAARIQDDIEREAYYKEVTSKQLEELANRVKHTAATSNHNPEEFFEDIREVVYDLDVDHEYVMAELAHLYKQTRLRMVLWHELSPLLNAMYSDD